MNKYTIQRNIKFKACGKFESEEEARRAAKEQYKKLLGSENITCFASGDAFASISEDAWETTKIERVITYEETLKTLHNIGCKELFNNHYYDAMNDRYYFITKQKMYSWSNKDFEIQTTYFEE